MLCVVRSKRPVICVWRGPHHDLVTRRGADVTLRSALGVTPPREGHAPAVCLGCGRLNHCYQGINNVNNNALATTYRLAGTGGTRPTRRFARVAASVTRSRRSINAQHMKQQTSNKTHIHMPAYNTLHETTHQAVTEDTSRYTPRELGAIPTQKTRRSVTTCQRRHI